MTGKIILKLNAKASFKSNRYEVFIDDTFIGFIDYKNSKIGYETAYGNHTIRIADKESEINNLFTISNRKPLVPIEINENYFWTNSQTTKFIKGITFGFLMVYCIAFIYFVVYKQIEINYSFAIPLFLMCWYLIASKTKQKFTLKFK